MSPLHKIIEDDKYVYFYIIHVHIKNVKKALF